MLRVPDKVAEYIEESLWVLPAAFALVAVVLALLTRLVDELLGGAAFAWLFRGDLDTAPDVLSTVASSIIAFTGIVFTITIVVLQLASQQFSPRILQRFLRDRLTQLALGTFVAAFVYPLMVLRWVGARDAPSPNLSMAVTLVLVLVSVTVFVVYLDHIAKSIRISFISARIGDETRAVIAARCSPDAESPDAVNDRGSRPARVLVARRPGVVNEVHVEELAALAAAESETTIEIYPLLGDFVARGSALAGIHGSPTRITDDDVLRAIDIGPERTIEQDPAFGFRQLVDIAVKAMSPAINDPTTAVQALDQIHDLLRDLAVRPLPRFRVYGNGRVVLRDLEWDDYVRLATTEIRQFGRDYIQVARRLRAMLLDLEPLVADDRAAILDAELRLLERSVADAFDEEDDRRLAGRPSRQGMGPPRD